VFIRALDPDRQIPATMPLQERLMRFARSRGGPRMGTLLNTDEEDAGIDADASDDAPAPADEAASEAEAGEKPKRQWSALRGWWWRLPHPGPGPDGYYGSGF
jgi:hypothetical protein